MTRGAAKRVGRRARPRHRHIAEAVGRECALCLTCGRLGKGEVIRSLGEKRNGASLLGDPQDLSAALGKAEDPRVRRRCAKLGGGNAEEGSQKDAADVRIGIGAGGDSTNQIVKIKRITGGKRKSPHEILLCLVELAKGRRRGFGKCYKKCQNGIG